MHAISALSTAVAFLCLAFALLLMTNLQRLETRWNSVGRLSVYLLQTATPSQNAEVVRALRATQGVTQVKHVAPESARGELLEHSPSALIAALPNDAFPASVEVELVEGLPHERIAQLVEQLQRLPMVESVETYAAWTARIAELVHGAQLVAICLSLVVFSAVVTVVGATTKLTLERRRDEVEVLRIVGATTSYVQKPFLIEGAAQGALGALVALVLCALCFSLLLSRFDQELQLLLGVAPRFLSAQLSVGLVGAGMALGALAAQLSLRKAFVA
jgi:cell division transport system permease protein